jgi:hypothetical protein
MDYVIYEYYTVLLHSSFRISFLKPYLESYIKLYMKISRCCVYRLCDSVYKLYIIAHISLTCKISFFVDHDAVIFRSVRNALPLVAG